MNKYASKTSVSIEKSQFEIKKTLEKYGATQFLLGECNEQNLASVQFKANDRHIRFMLKMPDEKDEDVVFTESGRQRHSCDIAAAIEQVGKQRWRALLLCIKAKLEAVVSGISSFEDEFLAHTMLPDGQTVGQYVKPQIEQAYLTGKQIPGIAGLIGGPSETT